VRPTLAEQLEGLDSPLSPPGIISVAIERTLRQYVHQKREAAAELTDKGAADAERRDLTLHFGNGLVELMRVLTQEQRLNPPRGGAADLRYERVSMWDAERTPECMPACVRKSLPSLVSLAVPFSRCLRCIPVVPRSA
jgi:hypothetical protein